MFLSEFCIEPFSKIRQYLIFKNRPLNFNDIKFVQFFLFNHLVFLKIFLFKNRLTNFLNETCFRKLQFDFILTKC